MLDDGDSTITKVSGAVAGPRERNSSEPSTPSRSTPSPACLGDEEILLYVEGNTSDEQRRRIERHLDGCFGCQEVVHFLVRDDDAAGERSLEVTTFVPGDVVLDRYAVERFVGKGGMGEVYRCFDRLLRRTVALKTVLCSVADSRRAVRQLYAEVRNAQRVAHSHVCRIYELQQHEDSNRFFQPVPFFTMEFVDGEQLGTWIHRDRVLPIGEVRGIAEQLLEGLEAAHERGILHLDFKSDNVMLRRSDAAVDAVIMDFGLSRAFGAQGSVLTNESAHFAGTLPYMSLEQLECRNDVGPAADVYAFGVVLYEMLTRRLPFEGASPSAMLLKQLKDRPDPPSRHRHGLSSSLDAFVLCCLSADPRARYRDAGTALAALRRVRSWEKPIRERRRVVWLGLTTAVAASLGSVGILVGGDAGRAGARANSRDERWVQQPLPLSPAPRPRAERSDPSVDPPPRAPDTTAEPRSATEPPAMAPAPAHTPAPARKRRTPPGERKPGPANSNWVPRAIPSGGFWQPTTPPSPTGGGELRPAR